MYCFAMSIWVGEFINALMEEGDIRITVQMINHDIKIGKDFNKFSEAKRKDK